MGIDQGFCRALAVSLFLCLPALAAESTKGRIDSLCLAKQREANVSPAPLASDPVFIRRVYLDTIGLLPTPDEVRTFLADTSADKREKLIEALLDRPEFADYWALKWGDLLRIKSEYPVRVWPKGAQTYHRWVRESIASNKPYDQFVRELLVSSGSAFRDGPANYYRAVPSKDPQTFAETTALLFMGARVGCARCHDHPAEKWTLDDDLGLAAFFAQVRFKATSEWKEEIVYIDPDAVYRNPKTKEIIKPRLLGGEPLTLKPGQDARAVFADWLVAPDNPWFARNAVNRIWYWLLGRGIVHQPDDLRPSNPPNNPELLDHLARELIDHKYDTKHLYRLILTSDTYQRSAGATSEGAVPDAPLFACYPVKRLSAEQLMDAISRVTETSENFSSSIPEPFTRLPGGSRATQLADGSITLPFLELFGRPPRDTPYQSERSCEPSMRQALHLLNAADIERKITTNNRLTRLIRERRTDAEIIDDLYLAALSRLPHPDEKRKLLAHAQSSKARPQNLQDVLWAILNSKEFLFNH
jgi:hypothetical protein